MFDVGFSELALCFLVALVVLGPQRLAPLSRSLGRWTGQARAYMRNLSAELERETQAGELKRQLLEAQQALREGAQNLQQDAQQTAQEVKEAVRPPTAETAQKSSGPLP